MMPRSRGLPPALAWTVFVALPGIILGFMAALLLAGNFATPVPLARETWHVVSPGLDETNVAQMLGRGSHVVDGELVIRQHVFYRADMLSPKQRGSAAQIELLLGPDTDIARIVIRDESGRNPLFFKVTPEFYMGGLTIGQWTPRDDDGVVRISVRDGVAWFEQRQGPVNLGACEPGIVELTAEEGEAHFRAIRIVSTEGRSLVDQDYRGQLPDPVALGVGALLGLLAAACLAEVGVRRGAVLLLPIVAVLLVDPGAWLAIAERLYLVRTGGWELARGALVASFAPLVLSAARSRGWTALRSGAAAPRAYIVVSLLSLAIGFRNDPLWALPAAALLAHPLLLARFAGADLALPREAPALAALAILGAGGLWIAIAWRIVVLAASAGWLVKTAPSFGAQSLFIHALLLLPALEVGIRSTYLDSGWDASRLNAELAPTVGWRDPAPYWEDTCGEGRTIGIVFAGGSSTGGAYQFRGEPTAFFPAATHQLLCASRAEGTAIHTTNFGDGGRDSFTISRSVESLMTRGEATLMVLYIGVNDIFTNNNTLTRKEREAREEERSAAMRSLAGVGMRSRLLTGVGLLLRPQQEPGGQTVSDVPLPDAEENLLRIADAARARSVRVLLVPEYVSPEQAHMLDAYKQMLARVAEAHDHVAYVDVYAGLAPHAGEDLLIDRNHLSRLGGRRVAAILAPAISELLR